MSYQVELNWPENESAASSLWAFDSLPRKGEVIHDTQTGKSAEVRKVVWFLGERGVKRVRIVLGITVTNERSDAHLGWSGITEIPDV